jgi:aldehyde:ferredoxin oxidoreductase
MGEHYGVHRVPTIKKQAISAYDPRVIEVTGVSMMVSAQGADHTTGNVPKVKSRDLSAEEIMDKSLEAQIACAATDSIGLCVFGRTTTNPNVAFMADAMNDALGTNIKPNFFYQLGRETLDLENEFNRQAGFVEADNDLPKFFYDEPLPPSNQAARFHAKDVSMIWDRAKTVGALGIPDEHAKLD